MRGPVITVDVSKGSCHYQPFLENGKPLRKPKVLHDTIEGFNQLMETIEMTKEKSTEERNGRSGTCETRYVKSNGSGSYSFMCCGTRWRRGMGHDSITVKGLFLCR